MREKIYHWFYDDENDSVVTRIYDSFMLSIVILSLIPLALKRDFNGLSVLDWIAIIIFSIDYILRLITADYKQKRGVKSFFLYLISPMAIIDLITIIPSFALINLGATGVRAARVIRLLRILRIVKAFRFSKNMRIVKAVFRRARYQLLLVASFVVGYILVVALIMFNYEPDLFQNYLDAVYWSVVTISTIGYGDIVPVTMAGKIITLISELFGIAVIALPAGIITAAYVNEVNELDKKRRYHINKYKQYRQLKHLPDKDVINENDLLDDDEALTDADMISEELRKFKKLLDEEMINREDYEQMKRTVLSKYQ